MTLQATPAAIRKNPTGGKAMKLQTWPYRGEGLDPLTHEIEAAYEEGQRLADALVIDHINEHGRLGPEAIADGERRIDRHELQLRKAWEGAERTSTDVSRVHSFAEQGFQDRFRQYGPAAGKA